MSEDLAAQRGDFPILSLTPHNKPLIYLDNAASTQKPRAVLDTMRRFYEQEYANVHRGLYYLANVATESYEAAREKLRRFLNARSGEEIIFTRSATEAINLVAASYGQRLREGDEIVLSIMEHHSNIVPWHFLREHKGVVLKWVDVEEDGAFSLARFEQALSPRTKFVAITGMSNVLGTVPPIAQVTQRAHAVGAPVLVDATQAAVHGGVDVQAWDADFVALTGHKLYGPTGIGALYGKTKLLADMPPFLGGGEMIAEVTRDHVTYNTPPHRFEAGTPPIAQAIGLGAALDYISHVGQDRIAAHEAALSAYAHERLSQIKGLQIYGTAAGKGPILAFNISNVHAHDVATFADHAGIAMRAGMHCAMPLLQHLGVSATCRVAFALYNTKAEVERLAEVLARIQSLLT